MSHSNIIEVSLFPISPEDFMDESTIGATQPWFIGQVADYFQDDATRDGQLYLLLAESDRRNGWEIQADANGEFIIVHSKEDYFRPAWEYFKKQMESTVSLEKFMSYRGEDDKTGLYVYADGELMTFAEFVRGCVVGEPYYIGGVLDYHS